MENKKTGGVLDLLGDMGNKHFYADKPIAKLHEFYLTGDITAPEDYIEWFDIIRTCGENDVVKIHINSGGGQLFTAVQMIRAVQDCPGTVITSIEGACMSAATMIFLNADVYEVSPHSMFMIHNYSGGTIGKGGEMFEQVSYERKWSEKFLHDIYDMFLTNEEISAVLDGKDIWLDSDQVIDRLNNRSDMLAALAEEEQKELDEAAEKEAEEVAKPKRTPRKKKIEEE